MMKFHCSMCFNAGRDSYNTHFLRESRDPNSKITCPFLLAIECRYCGKYGHTKNYCPVFKFKNYSSADKCKLVDNDGYKTVLPKLTKTKEAIHQIKPANKSIKLSGSHFAFAPHT